MKKPIQKFDLVYVKPCGMCPEGGPAVALEVEYHATRPEGERQPFWRVLIRNQGLKWVTRLFRLDEVTNDEQDFSHETVWDLNAVSVTLRERCQDV